MIHVRVCRTHVNSDNSRTLVIINARIDLAGVRDSLQILRKIVKMFLFNGDYWVLCLSNATYLPTVRLLQRIIGSSAVHFHNPHGVTWSQFSLVA